MKLFYVAAVFSLLACASDDAPKYTTMEDLTRHGACEIEHDWDSRVAFDYPDGSPLEHTALIWSFDDSPREAIWEDGRKIREYDPDGALSARWEYDDQGREKVLFIPDINFRYEYSYPAPDVKEAILFDNGRRANSRYTWRLTRDDSGRIARSEFTYTDTDSGETDQETTDYIYEAGRLVREDIISFDGDVGWARYKYECDWKSFPPYFED